MQCLQPGGGGDRVNMQSFAIKFFFFRCSAKACNFTVLYTRSTPGHLPSRLV
jgi:hypothetical protein